MNITMEWIETFTVKIVVKRSAEKVARIISALPKRGYSTVTVTETACIDAGGAPVEGCIVSLWSDRLLHMPGLHGGEDALTRDALGLVGPIMEELEVSSCLVVAPSFTRKYTRDGDRALVGEN